MRLAGLRLHLEASVGVADGERVAAVLEGGVQLPVRLRDEGAALALALRDQDQGRGLDAAHGEEGAPVALRGARDPPGECCAPDQVYVLPRLAGVGQLPGDVDEIVEGARDLALGEGGEARALDVVDELGVGLEGEAQGLDPYELSLPVVVRGYDHPVRLLGQRLDGVGHTLLGDGLEDLGVYEVGGLDLLPVRVLLGVLRVEHVALEPHRDALLALPGEGVVRYAAVLALLDGSLGQDLGYLLCRVGFLRDY